MPLRKLEQIDLSSLKEIVTEAFPGVYKDDLLQHFIKDEKFTSFGQEQDGEIVAVLIAEKKVNQREYEEEHLVKDEPTAPIILIHLLVVKKSHRKKGIASELLTQVMNMTQSSPAVDIQGLDTKKIQGDGKPAKCVYCHVICEDSVAEKFMLKHKFVLHSYMPEYIVVKDKFNWDAYTYAKYVNGGSSPWAKPS